MEGDGVYNLNGKRVGQIERRWGRLWIVKQGLNPKVHHLNSPGAWASDSSHVKLMETDGLAGMVLELTTGQNLWASLTDWLAKGVLMTRRHGAQKFLLDRYWHDVAAPQQLGFRGL